MISICFENVLFLSLCLSIAEASSFWGTSSKVDCSMTLWSTWSSANSVGQQTRIRRVMRYPQNGGKECPSLSETRVDSADCTVTPWSTWSANFGFGQQSRVRTVITQPIGSGKQCPTLEEIRYTGRYLGVNETGKNFQDFFVRPNGQHVTKGKRSTQTPNLPRDLVIIMDSSGSIGRVDFEVAKEQIAKLIALLCPNAPFNKIAGFPYQYNQAAMLTYSTYVVENFDFNTYNTTASIQNAINSVRYVGRDTNTNKAFDQARGLLQPSKGVRDAARAKREVLILTDGRSNSQSLTLAALKKLALEADVYGLMIGSFTIEGINELTQYVSSPADQHLFALPSFQELKYLMDFIETGKMMNGANWCAPFNP